MANRLTDGNLVCTTSDYPVASTEDVMLILGKLACLAAAAAAPALPVDFRLLNVPTPPTQQGQAEPPTVDDEPDAPGTVQSRPYAPVAQGFGNHVPLYFALRQIVPRSVPVHLGAGVNTRATVSWTGGRPWHHVLASAVSPLGYHVMVGWHSVTITR